MLIGNFKDCAYVCRLKKEDFWRTILWYWMVWIGMRRQLAPSLYKLLHQVLLGFARFAAFLQLQTSGKVVRDLVTRIEETLNRHNTKTHTTWIPNVFLIYRFIVDRRIYVVGFGLYGSIHGPCEYQATIQIIHTGSERLLGSSEVSFTSDGSNSTFRVMFKEPIEIQSNTNYTASATLKVIFYIFIRVVSTSFGP